MKRADGLKLVCVAGSYGNDNRIRVMHSRPRDDISNGGGYVEIWEAAPLSGRIADPSITVADTKTAAQIAADITRRLLPEAERVFRLVSARIAKSNAHRAARASLSDRFAAALGHGPCTGQHIARDADPTFDLNDNANTFSRGYGNARVNGDSVTFELRSVPAEKAVALAAWIRANLFT